MLITFIKWIILSIFIISFFSMCYYHLNSNYYSNNELKLLKWFIIFIMSLLSLILLYKYAII